MSMFRSINNEKIGYILNYFASDIKWLSMTKALKLLYLLDETSIKETGTPLTWLDYKVWKMGPVAIDIYNEIKREEVICYRGKELTISEYIRLEKKENKGRQEIYLHPKINFNEDLFNKYELELLSVIVSKFGNWPAEELIKYLHEENSLWHKMVTEYNLQDNFDNGINITNYSIEFTELIEDNPILMMANKSSFEALQFQQRLLDHASH
ncbi:MAG: hypothetical protein DI539_00150 [Flavobacterium psychrophilum]|nr:MAG: hypothetical protein DI539_00150 [Flavobacterium psychrophilum]